MADLTFTHDGEIYTLGQFYPKVKIDGVRFGIVLSQDCDLAWKKLPYITIGFLEPLSRFVRRDKNWVKAALPWTLTHQGEDSTIGLVSPDYLVPLLNKRFTDLLKNEEPSHFFVWFDAETGDHRHCVVNLTKAVPIRIEHYDAIRERMCWQLEMQFARKLGWKIAELYGRVGADDFDTATAKRLLLEMKDTVNDALSETYPEHITIGNDDFKQAEKLKDSGKPEKQRFIRELMKKYGQEASVIGVDEVQAATPNTQGVGLGKASEGINSPGEKTIPDESTEAKTAAPSTPAPEPMP